MDVAALVISIFAILLSVIVAGWAIYLQWCMFKATTDQLNLIGKENASLGERIAMSLGQLHETATTTRGRLDTAMDQLVSGLLGRGAPAAEGAAAEPEQIGGSSDAWRVEQAVRVFRPLRAAPRVLEYLAGGARDADDLATQLVGLRPEGEPENPWMWDIAAIIAVSNGLDLVDVDRDKRTVTLTACGTQVAARFSKGTDD